MTQPTIIDERTVAELRDEALAFMDSRLPNWPGRDKLADPGRILVDLDTYIQALIMARMNDAIRAAYVGTALGDDLDAAAALFGIERQGEPDELFRIRAKLGPHSIGGANGSLEQIRFTALSAMTQMTETITDVSPGRAVVAYEWDTSAGENPIRDVGVVLVEPAVVAIYVQAWEGDGRPSEATLKAVQKAFDPKARRMGGDLITVHPIEPVYIKVVVQVHGNISAVAVEEAVKNYANERHRPGTVFARSGLSCAIHDKGRVERVEVQRPERDVIPDQSQCVYVEDIQVEVVL